MVARLRSAAMVVAMLGLTSACLWAQSPGGQSGPSATTAAQTLSGGQVIVVVPRSRDAVLAYSQTLGCWCRQPIKVASNAPILPIVGDDVAAFKIGDEVFAFSAVLARWKSLSLPPDSKAELVVASKYVTIHAGNVFHVFSPKTCRWSSVNLDSGVIEAQKRDE